MFAVCVWCIHFATVGKGVTLYILDSGIKASHQEFQPWDGKGPGRVTVGPDFVDDDRVAADCDGHGTHVASTGGLSAGMATCWPNCQTELLAGPTSAAIGLLYVSLFSAADCPWFTAVLALAPPATERLTEWLLGLKQSL